MQLGLGLGLNLSSQGGGFPTADLLARILNETYESEGTIYYRNLKGSDIPVIGQDTDGQDILDFSVLSDVRLDKSNATYWGASLNAYFYYDVGNPYYGKLQDYHYKKFNTQVTFTNTCFLKAEATTSTSNIIDNISELLIYSTTQENNNLIKAKSYIGIQATSYGLNIPENYTTRTATNTVVYTDTDILIDQVTPENISGIAWKGEDFELNDVVDVSYEIYDYEEGVIFVRLSILNNGLERSANGFYSEEITANEIYVGSENRIGFRGVGTDYFKGKIRNLVLRKKYEDYYGSVDLAVLGTTNYIRSIQWGYNDVTSDFLIEPPTTVCSNTVIAGGDNANTGLAYDFIKHEFFVVTLEPAQKIIRYDRNFNILGYINPSSTFSQGITVDVLNEILYIWLSSGDNIEAYDYDGNYLYSIPLIENIDGVAGSLEFDYRTNKIVTRATNDGVVDGQRGYTYWHYLKQSYRQIYRGKTLDDDECLGISQWWYDYHLFVGKILSSQIRLYDYFGNLIDTYANPSDDYLGEGGTPQLEGLIFDPTDGTVWFNADQYFHGAIDGGNRIWHIDPLENYNKFLMFPAISYSLFKITGLTTRYSNLLIEGTSGTVISPVIDFETYTIQQVLDNLDIDTDLSYTIEFKGSDTVPDTEVTDIFNLEMYDANNSNEGWGTTVPSEFQATVPDLRYLQFKITI